MKYESQVLTSALSVLRHYVKKRIHDLNNGAECHQDVSLVMTFVHECNPNRLQCNL